MQVQLTQDREIGSISAAARPGRVKQFKKHWLFVTLLYLAITLAFQHLTGVYQSEFGHHPDEAAHVVTSLMIRDYLASGFHGNPLRYAENYYVHYPKVAFGMWPPGFHIASAMWMLIFPPTRTTLLCFMALQTTILAVSLGIFAGRLFGDLAGAALGLLLLCLPLIQWGTSIVMLDMCVALFQFSAMCFAVRYFKTERVRWAVLFGICSAGAMLTKGTANGVVLVPVVMLLLTRRFSILRKPGLYIAASIIFVLGLPWQLISWRLYQSTIPIAHVDTIYMWTRFTLYIVMLVQKLSTPLCVLALLGLLVQCWKLLRLPSVSLADGDIRLAGTISLLIGITVLHIVAPISAPDFRYTIPALPAILILFAAGVRWVAERIPARVQQATKNSVIAGIALVIFASTTFAIPVRGPLGVSEALDFLPYPSKSKAILICSDADGEGAFVAEVALRDRRPDEIVLRASKVLSEDPWFTADRYRPLLHTAAEAEEYLESVPVDSIVIDLTIGQRPQDRQLLLDTIKLYPFKWYRVGEIQEDASRHHLLVYRRTGAESDLRPKKVRIRMRFTFGHDFLLQK